MCARFLPPPPPPPSSLPFPSFDLGMYAPSDQSNRTHNISSCWCFFFRRFDFPCLGPPRGEKKGENLEFESDQIKPGVGRFSFDDFKEKWKKEKSSGGWLVTYLPEVHTIHTVHT